jgi:hypothetical protein
VPIDAPCPTCGEPVWRSVAAAVDLAATGLDPRAIGTAIRALPALGGALLGAVVLTVLPPSIWALLLLESPAAPPRWTAIAWWLVAALLALPGWRVGWAARRDQRHRTRHRGPGESLAKDLAPLDAPSWILVVAAPAWALCGSVATQALPLGETAAIVAALGAAVLLGPLLLAAGILLERLGPLSPRWRARGAARQSPWLLAGTLAGSLAFASAALLAAEADWPDPVTLLSLLGGASLLMVLLGSAYLWLNACWIAGDLRPRHAEIGRLLEGRCGTPGSSAAPGGPGSPAGPPRSTN